MSLFLIPQLRQRWMESEHPKEALGIDAALVSHYWSLPLQLNLAKIPWPWAQSV